MSAEQKEMFYSASVDLQATIYTRKSKIMDKISTVTSRITEMELPVVDEERMAAFYTLDTCEATSTIRSLYDDCIEVLNYKDTLSKHMKNKHKVRTQA